MPKSHSSQLSLKAREELAIFLSARHPSAYQSTPVPFELLAPRYEKNGRNGEALAGCPLQFLHNIESSERQ